jgi:hypothetical protein
VIASVSLEAERELIDGASTTREKQMPSSDLHSLPSSNALSASFAPIRALAPSGAAAHAAFLSGAFRTASSISLDPTKFGSSRLHTRAADLATGTS